MEQPDFLNKSTVINILTIRTHYPQWAARSGIHQYLNYLNKDMFEVTEKLVPMGDDRFPIKKNRVRESIKRTLKKYSHNNIYELNDFMAELSSVRFALSHGADIIQYFDSEHTMGFLPGFLKKSFLGKRRPFVIGMFHQPKGVLKDLVSPEITLYLDHVILMSSEQKGFFAGKFPDDRISVILHGIDTDYYRPDASKKKNPAKFRCITVGNWLRDYETVREVAESLQKHPSIEFHIVSDINLKDKLGNIFIHKNICDEELLRLYQGADLLFMPLKDSTANNAILEGIACGLPVLTTDLPAAREYLLNTDAVFVKNNERDLFRKHILDFAEHREKKAWYGERSRERALKLTWPIVADNYAQLYVKIVNERANA